MDIDASNLARKYQVLRDHRCIVTDWASAVSNFLREEWRLLATDLIIVRAGKRSLHQSWLEASMARHWDLLICPYEEIPRQPTGVSGLSVSDVVPTPAKWSGLKFLLDAWSGWRDYRYITLADDDLLATQENWSRFFERCAQFGAKLAQPALLEDSYFSHTVTVRNSEFVARRASYVEIMMPCFRSDVLADMLATFPLSESGEGWGLDFLWPKMLGYRDVFVIDDAPVLHTRQLRARNDAALSQKLNAEMLKLMRDQQLPWLLKTFAGILPNGEVIAEGHASFLYRLFRGYERIFASSPGRFDEMIRLQLAATPAA